MKETEINVLFYIYIYIYIYIHIYICNIYIKEDKYYLIEAEKQLSCKKTYEEASSDPSFVIKTIHSTLEKIRKTRDISSDILVYFNVQNPKFGRFCLLPKIHKRMYDIPGRPVISNCDFYTEDISAF